MRMNNDTANYLYPPNFLFGQGRGRVRGGSRGRGGCHRDGRGLAVAAAAAATIPSLKKKKLALRAPHLKIFFLVSDVSTSLRFGGILQ